MIDFRRSMIHLQFYTATSEGRGAAGGLYYGYGVEGDTIFCREGFKVTRTNKGNKHLLITGKVLFKENNLRMLRVSSCACRMSARL